jgi:hypothetical protein
VQSINELFLFKELSSDSSLPKKQLVALEENEQRIRLALAKNLAVAIIKVIRFFLERVD